MLGEMGSEAVDSYLFISWLVLKLANSPPPSSAENGGKIYIFEKGSTAFFFEGLCHCPDDATYEGHSLFYSFQRGNPPHPPLFPKL